MHFTESSTLKNQCELGRNVRIILKKTLKSHHKSPPERPTQQKPHTHENTK